MDKSLVKSKTVWGIAIAGLIALGQTFGIGAESTIAEVVQIIASIFAAYGIRDAL